MSVELNETSVSTHQSKARRTRLTAALRLIVSVLILTTLAACSPTRVMMHHEEARERLITLQEHQIQDNLVRIKEGLNFLHVNYKSIKGVSYDELTGKGEFGDDDKITAAEGSVVIDNDLGNFPRGQVALKFTDQFDVLGEPVMGNKTVYDAYIIFAEEFIKEGEPEEGTDLWTRKASDGSPYHLPNSPAARKAYQRIVLLTTLDQGKTSCVAYVYVKDVDRASLKITLDPDVKLKSGFLFASVKSDDEEDLTMIPISLRRAKLSQEKKPESTTSLRTVTMTKNGKKDTTITESTDTRFVDEFGYFAVPSNRIDQQMLVKFIPRLKDQWVMLEYEPASSGSSPATIRIGKDKTNIQVRP